MAYGIGGYFGHDASFFNSGSSFTDAAEKAVAHGVSRAALAYARGEKVSSAFWSGFASSAFSVGTKGYGGFYGRTAIMAVVGGTTSRLTGGKFANGAVTGAFIQMFNVEFSWKRLWNGLSGGVNGVYDSRDRIGDDVVKMWNKSPWYAKAPLVYSGGIVGVGTYSGGVLATGVVLTHPIESIYVGEVTNDVINDSMPPSTPHGALINIVIKVYNYVVN